jgi:transposase-like protein
VGSQDALPRELTVFGRDPLTERLRGMIGTFIEELVREELEEALAARRYQRGNEIERRGYRHTKRTRTLSTSMGPTTITIQRGRLFDEDGEASIEWQSKLLPRYQRRTHDVDDAIVNAYLSGANTRRIRGALKPMLKNAPLSKSAVSRAVRNLKASFDEWRTSRLDEKDVVFLYLDAISVKVRVDRKVQSMNMLVALGVHRDGSKEVLAMMLAASESRNAWGAMLEDLLARGLREPILCIIDGSKGLRSALESKWPKVQVQRCVVHKLRNLEVYCPKRSLDDLRADFHAITEAGSEKAAKMAYERFCRVWKNRSENVVASIEEAGEELCTHYRFPRSMWKCLRTTNAIERLHGEFRRRLKTQASLPNESSALMVFYGVIASGQIRMRRIDGWQDIDKAIAKHQPDRLRDAA